jgi:hypothetical protein
MHWLRVPLSINVPLSASLRQSSVVLGKGWDQKFWRGRTENDVLVAGELLFRPDLVGYGLAQTWDEPGEAASGGPVVVVA